MMRRSRMATASLIIAVICISALGNLKRIIRIRIMQSLLDFTVAPPTWWLLGLLLFAQVWNHSVDAKLGDGTRSPYMIATSCGDDISPYICYSFYEPVYACIFDNTSFLPSEYKEVCCRWAGVSEHVGGPMTWTLVTDKTQKIIHRLSIQSALDPNLRNLSLHPLKTTDVKMLDYPFDIDFDTKKGR